MRTDIVTESKLRSPLLEAMRVSPRSCGRRKNKMVATLILTSLVDAFVIMLLYLLCQNTGNGSTLELAKSEQLPFAVKTDALHAGTLVRVENGVYFLGDRQVAQGELAARLQELKMSLGTSPEAEALIIQADRGADFSALVPVIRAGSISGFGKFRFAVLQGEGNEGRL